MAWAELLRGTVGTVTGRFCVPSRLAGGASFRFVVPDLYLYGSDRATIIETITKGRVNMMPAFEDQLTPVELKAVSVYVLSHAATEEASRRGASNRSRRASGAKGAARVGGLTDSHQRITR
jgi:hypothetical protein